MTGNSWLRTEGGNKTVVHMRVSGGGGCMCGHDYMRSISLRCEELCGPPTLRCPSRSSRVPFRA